MRANRMLGAARVLAILMFTGTPIPALWASSVDLDESLVTTREHRFWVSFREAGSGKWRGQWLEASDLRPGDHLLLVDGREVVVAKSESVSAAQEHTSTTSDNPPNGNESGDLRTPTAYNFEVADFNTYFVGQDGVWVHNQCEKRYRDYLIRDEIGNHVAAWFDFERITTFDLRHTVLRERWYRKFVSLAGQELRISLAIRKWSRVSPAMVENWINICLDELRLRNVRFTDKTHVTIHFDLSASESLIPPGKWDYFRWWILSSKLGFTGHGGGYLKIGKGLRNSRYEAKITDAFERFEALFAPGRQPPPEYLLNTGPSYGWYKNYSEWYK